MTRPPVFATQQSAPPGLPDSRVQPGAPRRSRTLWGALVGAVGGVAGLAPHVLHHVGLLIGAAVIAGTAGTVLFAVIGLVASVPILLRLRRRFGRWWAPGIAVVVFAAMFALSTFVIGPAITGSAGSGAPAGVTPAPAPTSSTDHAGHHRP